MEKDWVRDCIILESWEHLTGLHLLHQQALCFISHERLWHMSTGLTYSSMTITANRLTANILTKHTYDENTLMIYDHHD